MDKNFKINFVGIGTGRAASTWIYECLREHPEICMSRQKETKYLFNNTDPKKYKNFFKDCDSNKKTGEYTPGYMYSREAAKNIKKINPNIKIIACLRNPIERTISSYYFSKVRGEVLFDDLERKINQDIDNFNKEQISYIERGKYYKYLKYYFELFPRENILILIFDDIEKDPKKFIKSIYLFLEVDDAFVPSSVQERINFVAKNRRRFPGFTKVYFQTREKLNGSKTGQNILKIAKFFKINKIVNLLLNLNLRDLKNKKLKEIKKQSLSIKTRKKLFKLFEKDICQLEKLLKKDLSNWKIK